MIALRSSKVAAPLATVVAVAGIAVGVSLASGGSSAPTPLRLAGSAAAETAAAPAADAKLAAGGGYALAGDLPAGTPDDAPAYDLPSGPGAAGPVARLADALGAGTPVRNNGGWSADGLQVSGESGRSWYWSPCGPDAPTTAVSPTSTAACVTVDASTETSTDGSTDGSSDASTGSGSAPAAGSASSQPLPGPATPVPGIAVGEPVPSQVEPPTPPGAQTLALPRTPSEAEVRAAAAPVLEALGLSGGRVEVYAGGGSLVVDPQVGGLPTVGWSTFLNVGADGTLAGASGWLATPERGDAYPLVSAQAAYDALPQLATSMLCPVTPQGSCAKPAPTTITGAHLGLTLSSLAEGGQVLVPAWLFDVKDSTQPIAGVAVDPTYLPAPEQPVTEPGTSSGSGSSGSGGSVGGTEPAQTDPAPPVDPVTTDPGTSGPAGKQPAGSEPNSDLPRAQVAIVGWTASKADNAVTVLFDNGGCGQQDVRADVKEDAQHVYVALTAIAPPPDQVCTKDYAEAPFEVALQGPLGTRDVVHATTGEPVPEK